ncbi:hypothetical protein [Labrys wisconsinensis]|uniref:Uncharacterized protein n=1 Tax=Labrys wisconsinensis TaxID=425677 RepID=A0ABU0J0C2_9HYPH|nr:hypothetical protein [Labrys wisconsinensis]MDQ0467712.1 hypothetical protein [Labrys wisconsinensis]
MSLGEIYLFETTKAQGYALRQKYHLCICESTWKEEGFAFLFISKADYGGDYPLLKEDYNFFPLDTSYISCNDIVVYSADELAIINPSPIGLLKNEHLRELYNHILASRTMAGWQIKLVGNALKAVL